MLLNKSCICAPAVVYIYTHSSFSCLTGVQCAVCLADHAACELCGSVGDVFMQPGLSYHRNTAVHTAVGNLLFNITNLVDKGAGVGEEDAVLGTAGLCGVACSLARIPAPLPCFCFLSPTYYVSPMSDLASPRCCFPCYTSLCAWLSNILPPGRS